MKPSIILKDVNKWKRLNKDGQFSLYDYIFHTFNFQKIDTDIYLALLEMFWPTFISYKNYFFLKENFSEKKFEDLITQNENVELWINFLNIDPYFQNEKDRDQRAELLSKYLVKMWTS